MTSTPDSAEDKRKRLLIIDDEDALLIPAAHYLRERGYSVVTAREPEEAQALLDRQRFDLVILDLALTPFGREGLDILGWIRSRHPSLPVIILSAEIPLEVEQEAHRLGADAVLGKPQPMSELARLAGSFLSAR
jgi:DNA-binding response OmpR family regulator